jgi:murein peptide amidase A
MPAMRGAGKQRDWDRCGRPSRGCTAIAAGLLLLISIAPASVATAARPVSRTIVIGRSVRGRPLVARVIGPDSAPRKVLIVGCIHGNECAGEAIVSALARRQPSEGVQLWLVPEMNPDGTAAGTRQNAHGVDLNRNFPYQWQALAEPTYYAGPKPLSEPESRAAVRLIRRVKPTVTIWYHQHEDLVDMAGGDRGVARRYAHLAGLRASCLPFLPGTATAWSNHSFPGRAHSWWSCLPDLCERARSLATSGPYAPSNAGSGRDRGRLARREAHSAALGSHLVTASRAASCACSADTRALSESSCAWSWARSCVSSLTSVTASCALWAALWAVSCAICLPCSSAS